MSKYIVTATEQETEQTSTFAVVAENEAQAREKAAASLMPGWTITELYEAAA